MKRVFSALALLAVCSRAHAAGMSDYTFKIDETHSVICLNSFDITVGKSNSSLYNSFSREESVSGPLREIFWDNDFIFLKHAGRKKRNSFPGDAFLEADDTTNLYYTIRRGTDDITGPFNRVTFGDHLAAIGYTSEIPWNPLSEARKDSVRRFPFQTGVWVRMLVGLFQIPGAVFAFALFYVVVSAPVILALVILRRIRRCDWKIAKWWKRGLAGSLYCAIAWTVISSVFYAYS